jgi:hypothetical protein
MPVLIRYAPPAMTRAQYDKVGEGLEAANQWPPDGMILHVCFGDEGKLRVSEVWESHEKLEQFQTVLMPLVVENGIDIESNQPELLDVQTIESRQYSTNE